MLLDQKVFGPNFFWTKTTTTITTTTTATLMGFDTIEFNLVNIIVDVDVVFLLKFFYLYGVYRYVR